MVEREYSKNRNDLSRIKNTSTPISSWIVGYHHNDHVWMNEKKRSVSNKTMPAGWVSDRRSWRVMKCRKISVMNTFPRVIVQCMHKYSRLPLQFFLVPSQDITYRHISEQSTAAKTLCLCEQHFVYLLFHPSPCEYPQFSLIFPFYSLPFFYIFVGTCMYRTRCYRNFFILILCWDFYFFKQFSVFFFAKMWMLTFWLAGKNLFEIETILRWKFEAFLFMLYSKLPLGQLRKFEQIVSLVIHDMKNWLF